MTLKRIQVATEWHPAQNGVKGLFCYGDAIGRMEALLPEPQTTITDRFLH